MSVWRPHRRVSVVFRFRPIYCAFLQCGFRRCCFCKRPQQTNLDRRFTPTNNALIQCLVVCPTDSVDQTPQHNNRRERNADSGVSLICFFLVFRSNRSNLRRAKAAAICFYNSPQFFVKLHSLKCFRIWYLCCDKCGREVKPYQNNIQRRQLRRQNYTSERPRHYLHARLPLSHIENIHEAWSTIINIKEWKPMCG